MATLKEKQQQKYLDLSQLNNKERQDWTMEQLQRRLAHAEELLPMPLEK